MDFVLTEAQRELAALTRTILDDWADQADQAGQADAAAGRDQADAAAGRDQAGGVDGWLWSRLAGAGVLAAALPESMGGSGLGLAEECSVLAEIGRAVAPAPYLSAIVLGAGAVARFGTPDQQRRWAGPAGRGELIPAAALEEDDSDGALNPSASAVPATTGPASSGGAAAGWVLSGTKTAVPAGTRADVLLVPATTDDGVAVFLVMPDDPGATVVPQELTGASAARVGLDRVALPADRVLGSVAAGQQIVSWLVARGTAGLCALQYGVLERALELTAQYARERVQFGRPIGSFQAVAQRLADAYIDVEAVRLTMWQAAWRLAAGLDAAAEVATAKFWAAEAGHRVAHTAVHVHGGMGVDISGPVQRYFLAAKQHEFALGGATAQLRRLGALLAAGD